MGILEIILIGISVAGDAFAVSICKGITSQKKLKTALICGVWFALFQMLMPAIGYILGDVFYTYIEAFDHWIVFILLALIGINMIKSVFGSEEEDNSSDTSIKTMFLLALATSIDACAVGVSMALVKTNMWIALPVIGGITFTLCVVGGVLGQRLGDKNKKITTIIGGSILILLGLKILLEHLFF